MAPKKKKPTLTPAQKQLQATLLQDLGGSSSTTQTGPEIRLPNAAILEKEGVPKKEAQAFGLSVLKLDTTEVGTGATLGFTKSLEAAIDALPKNLQLIVENRLGFNDTRLGKTLDERISAMLPSLQAANGHIGNVDLKVALANETSKATVAKIKATLGTYAAALSQESGALSSGNEAALIGASQSARYSAEANADSDLTNWGLDTPELDSLVHRMVANGVTNTNEILQNVRETATYKAAFPGLAEYNSKPGQIHMTESEYRTYSQAIQNSAQQYGGVRLNQAQVSKLLNGNVSASEFQQRTQDIGVAVANADQTTKNLLKEQYGINQNHLFAYYANPKEALPDMQRAVASGEIQDYAARVGLGGLTPVGARQLGDMAKLSATQGNNPLGAGVSQIEGSLLTASKDSALLKTNPGQGAPTVSTADLIGSQLAGFGGTNQAAAQIEVGRAEGARTAGFEKGGGFAEDGKGVYGLGSTPT